MDEKVENEAGSQNQDSYETKDVQESDGARFPKRRLVLPVLILLVLVFLTAGGAFLFTKYKSLIFVAKVNGEYITRRELHSDLVKSYGSTALEDLINKTLVKNELREKGISITAADVDSKVQEIEASLGGLNLEEALSFQGVSLEDFREQVELQVGMEKLLASRIEVTPEDVDKFITDYGEQIQGETEGEKRDKAADMVINQRIQQEIGTWIQELRDAAVIENYL